MEEALRDTTRRDSSTFLLNIAERLIRAGYDLSDIELLGEGAESSAYLLRNKKGLERVLKITSPLAGGWEPDWGRRPFDARAYTVFGEIVHELSDSCFWFIQEFAEIIERAEHVEESLFEDFEEQIDCNCSNLFEDHTHRLKQIGIVERDGEQKIVLVDYSAFSSNDQSLVVGLWQ